VKLVLSQAQKELLHEVISKRNSRLLSLLSSPDADRLSSQDRSDLCAAVGAEFAETGTDEAGEPTERGLVLEALLDAINRPNLRP
jgi:hypothetical protein